MKFEHYLITRFNVGLYDKPNRYLKKVDPKKWMDHRLGLFKNFCFPSIKNQVCQNFKWIVLYDPKTPEHYINPFKKYANFIPACMGYQSIPKYIKEHADKDTTHIITTRLDNDDALNENYMGLVQQLFNGQDNTYFNFTQGLVFDVRRKRLRRWRHNSNPFLSLVEKLDDNFRTVLKGKHGHVKKLGSVVQVKKDRMWLQVIHNRNVSNGFKGTPVKNKLVLYEFHPKFKI